MPATRIETLACILAVCRELLDDGHEWSIYVVNALAQPVDLVVEQADWEWGDMGHVARPGTRVCLSGGGVARILRVDGADAELRMSVTLLLATEGTLSRLSFELGKLCKYRDPTPLRALGMPGWLRTADAYQNI